MKEPAKTEQAPASYNPQFRGYYRAHESTDPVHAHIKEGERPLFLQSDYWWDH